MKLHYVKFQIPAYLARRLKREGFLDYSFDDNNRDKSVDLKTYKPNTETANLFLDVLKNLTQDVKVGLDDPD